ncbi:MAG: hypothetical protein IJH18_00720 [Bacilli bacterium]|nr:hypothetical protein [Bacilli bacterium]
MKELKEYYKILKPSDIPITKQIAFVIDKEMRDIYETEGLCTYVANNISHELNNKHILNRIVDISDVSNSEFSHKFVLVFDNIEDDYYLVDPTYEQFVFRDEELNDKLGVFPNEELVKTETGKKLSDLLLCDSFSRIDQTLFYEYVHSFDQSIEEDKLIKMENIFLNIKEDNKNGDFKRIR